MRTATFTPANPAHLARYQRLLAAAQLPQADLTEAHLAHFFAAGVGAETVGLIGVEPYGEVGLLRSLVVTPAMRGQQLGQQLVVTLEAYAAEQGLTHLYLLTTTAEAFFARLGYGVRARRDAPAVLQQTTEFSVLCPDSAVCMMKRLG